MKKIDMIGFVSGRLTVTEAAETQNGRSFWKCHCECGKDVIVTGYSLRSGKTKSCGYCLGGKPIDITNRRFGMLTAVECVGSKGNGRYWMCRCDCGNTTTVRAAHLLSGATQSCGCMNKAKPNEYKIDGDVVYVTLTGTDKKTMICDLDDWNRLKGCIWGIAGGGYATAFRKDVTVEYKEFHRNVIAVKDGFVVDHINRNRLDNRKCNLRLVTAHLNSLNKTKECGNKSGYLGVSRKGKKWQARITLSNKTISLGTYSTKDEAIEARKRGEEKYFSPLFNQ